MTDRNPTGFDPLMGKPGYSYERVRSAMFEAMQKPSDDVSEIVALRESLEVEPFEGRYLCRYYIDPFRWDVWWTANPPKPLDSRGPA